jgi:hypothetical protein
VLDLFIGLIWSHLAFHADFYLRLLDVISWNFMLSHLSLDFLKDCLIDLWESISFALHFLGWPSLSRSDILWVWISISKTTIFTGAILNRLNYSWAIKRANIPCWSFWTPIFEITVYIAPYSRGHAFLLLSRTLKIGRMINISRRWENLYAHWTRARREIVIGDNIRLSVF